MRVRLFQGLRSWLAGRVMDRLFPLLVAQRRDTAQPMGAGVLPLPWTGPNGAIVVVVLDDRGRMTCDPIVCRTARELMAAQAIPTPIDSTRVLRPARTRILA